MLRRRRRSEGKVDANAGRAELGTIRVSSGSLVVIDAGYLGAWSG